jgi:hypothetical protein
MRSCGQNESADGALKGGKCAVHEKKQCRVPIFRWKSRRPGPNLGPARVKAFPQQQPTFKHRPHTRPGGPPDSPLRQHCKGGCPCGPCIDARPCGPSCRPRHCGSSWPRMRFRHSRSCAFSRGFCPSLFELCQSPRAGKGGGSGPHAEPGHSPCRKGRVASTTRTTNRMIRLPMAMSRCSGSSHLPSSFSHARKAFVMHADVMHTNILFWRS